MGARDGLVCSMKVGMSSNKKNLQFPCRISNVREEANSKTRRQTNEDLKTTTIQIALS